MEEKTKRAVDLMIKVQRESEQKMIPFAIGEAVLALHDRAELLSWESLLKQLNQGGWTLAANRIQTSPNTPD